MFFQFPAGLSGIARKQLSMERTSHLDKFPPCAADTEASHRIDGGPHLLSRSPICSDRWPLPCQLGAVQAWFPLVQPHCSVPTGACSVLTGAGSVQVWFPPVRARCWLGSRRCRPGAALAWFPPLGSRQCRVGSHRCRLGSRGFPIYPDQISLTLKGSISIDSPELRWHPSNALILLLRTLRVHLCAILVQLFQRVDQRIKTTE